MPPDGKLAEAEIADLNRWVQDGAVWPDSDHTNTPDSAGAVHKTSELLWSLQPVRDVPLPDMLLRCQALWNGRQRCKPQLNWERQATSEQSASIRRFVFRPEW